MFEVRGGCGPSCETKPIWLRLHPATKSNGAKQSQFGSRQRAPVRPNVRNKANLHPHRGVGGASPTLHVGATALNKPNLAPTPFCNRVRWCQTNPIRARTAGPAGANVRNKAKLGRTEIFGKSRRMWSGCTGRWNARNKANFRPRPATWIWDTPPYAGRILSLLQVRESGPQALTETGRYAIRYSWLRHGPGTKAAPGRVYCHLGSVQPALEAGCPNAEFCVWEPLKGAPYVRHPLSAKHP